LATGAAGPSVPAGSEIMSKIENWDNEVAMLPKIENWNNDMAINIPADALPPRSEQ